MSELETVVSAVEGEAKTVAEAVSTEVKAAETEAAKVETDVKAEVVKAATDVKAEVAKVEEKVKAAVVQVTTEEKLVLREAELEYLKAQMEIQRLAKITEAKSKEYTAFIDNLFKKYALDKAEYVFDGAINAFKKL